jgi:hypothetical protein
LVDSADRALIEAAARGREFGGLRPIKDELPERIGYDSIRLVVANLRRR